MWLITKPGKLESKSINLDNVVSFGLRVKETHVSEFFIRFRYNGDSYEDIFLDTQDIDEALTCCSILYEEIANCFDLRSNIIYGLHFKRLEDTLGDEIEHSENGVTW